MRQQASDRNVVLDQATRNRRQRKALEALEKDNFLDDLPTLSVSDYRIQLNKKFQQKFTINETAGLVNDPKELTGSSLPSASSFVNVPSSADSGGDHSSKRRRIKAESKLRFKKNFATLIEEEVSLCVRLKSF